MATLNFFPDQKIIEVAAPDTEVTIQEIINAIAVQMESLLWFEDRIIAQWSGKRELQLPGEFTGITLTLLNNWRVKFEDRAGPDFVKCSVIGGNLTALLSRKAGQTQGDKQYPVAPATFVSDSIAQAVSPTFSVAQQNKQLQYAIETKLSRTHVGTGDAYYVDPTLGDDLFDGLFPEQVTAGSLRGPKKTFAAAMALVQESHHDIIFLVQSNIGDISVLNENIVIDKEDMMVRGPGPGFHIVPVDPDDYTCRVISPQVEVTNCHIIGNPAGSASAVISLESEEPRLYGIRTENSPGEGIYVGAAASKFHIENCRLHDNAGHAIHVEGAAKGIILGEHTNIFDNDVGIHLSGVADSHTTIQDVLVYNNRLKGVVIDSGHANALIRSSVSFTGNGTAQAGGADPDHDIENNESSTIIEGNIQQSLIKAHAPIRHSIATIQNVSHVGYGKVIYVDPVNGNDDWDGLEPSRAVTKEFSGPKLTFAAALALASPYEHDVIEVVESSASGNIIGNIDINVNDLTVRGVGTGIVFLPSNPNDPTITVSAERVYLKGLNVLGLAGNSPAVVDVDSEDAFLHGLTVTNGPNAGIRFTSNAARSQIEDGYFVSNGGPGILLQGSEQLLMFGNRLFVSGNQYGIYLDDDGGNPQNVTLRDATVSANLLKGIHIEAGYNGVRVSDSLNFGSFDNGVSQVGGAGPQHNIENLSSTTKIVPNHDALRIDIGSWGAVNS